MTTLRANVIGVILGFVLFTTYIIWLRKSDSLYLEEKVSDHLYKKGNDTQSFYIHHLEYGETSYDWAIKEGHKARRPFSLW